MVPSSSMVISAPVSSWIELIIFPLGPITSPILSTGTLMVMIRGPRLLERAGQDRRRDAVELGVELEGGDHLGGAGHLEVHVAERVLGAEDVGKGDVLTALADQPHGDARHH